MRVLKIFGFSLLLNCLFAASGNAAGIKTNIPTSSFSNPAAFWGAVAQEFYGAYDKKLKCWIGNFKDQDGPARLCMRPHKLISVDVDGLQQHFLAFAGYQINKERGHDTCHACSGKMGLAVLSPGGETFSLVASDGFNTAIGSWGEAPHEDNFELRQIGENGSYGWLIHTGYTGQGYTYLSASVHGLIGDRVADLGYVPTGFNDQGNCDDNGKNYSSGLPCSDYEADVLFTDDSVGGFKTIALKHGGTYEGEPYDDVVLVPFDINEGQYKAPEGLLKDG